MQFNDDVVGGTILVRPAIQSPDYQQGKSGWSINQDGSVEFAQTTMHSADGTGNVVTIANGELIVKDSAGTTVFQMDAGGYRLYLSNGTLVADITRSGGDYGDPGVITYASSGQRYYAMLGSGYVLFADAAVSYDSPANVSHHNTSGSDPSVVTIDSGLVGTGSATSSAYDSATLLLKGMDAAGTTRPNAHFTTAGGAQCDLEVSGILTAANRIVGTASITPSAADTPTSLAITFPKALQGTKFVCQVTPQTSVPGTTVQGVGYSGLSATGVTLWLDRSNTTATTLSYTVEGY